MKKFILIITLALSGSSLFALQGGPNLNPCDGPNPPAFCPTIPIDTHLGWLFLLGLILIGVQFYKMNKTKSTI